jgi:hypothetical protein
MRYLLLAASAAIAFTSAALAQRVVAYDPTVGAINECQPSGLLLPGPVPPVLAYPQVPLLPAMAPPAGDSTFDNLRAFHWFTNGAILAAQPTPMFPPAGPLPPPMPIPAAVLAAIGGGPITGIAIDAAAGIMFLTGMPGMTIGVTPLPGMPVVVPPFPLPFAAGPITGLEWDSATGQLIAVDAVGVTYRYFPGGAPAAPPLPPPMAFGPMVTDVAIDRTMAPNAFGLRPLYVLAGPSYFDVHDPAPAPQPAGPGMGQGLAFMNHPSTNKPGGPCICPGTAYPAPGPTTNSPMTAMNAGFGVSMSGLPPGFPVIFGFDVAGFLPGFPVINPPVGCGLGLTLGPSTLLFAGLANALGVATYPVPLVPPYFFPGAAPVFNQNATVCPADPTYGLVLSPMQSIYTCVP